ncbi:hypothetical protein AB4Z09_06520 [Rhodococcus sp. TAF43]|uniref:DUF7144 family membrane protein n=1 Tax=unclassified Rhodococcus (in: high G+C Gram-positive bacteria) TaxID=192944 RepID=UPI000E0AC5CC|nr:MULTISPECIES: hypothetical protein [unclassified Rhodococcus (in: high G+C Gram-positive bacteria)]QKT12582.1 hypothetical protein HUN07_19435 [Rhodococcus sp. W8901]RDI25713.1 hypothetical protein DEU38_10957 [Rhodococcus sp. AG1013]
MTDRTPTTHSSGGAKQGFAAGASIAAAIILMTVGILQIFQGISALADDNFFVVGPEYVYQFDLTTWGWIHLILGIVVVLVGLGLLTGATWSRVTAIIIAALSIIANFLWIPWYPMWSILIIALDIVVIWAVSTWDTERA